MTPKAVPAVATGADGATTKCRPATSGLTVVVAVAVSAPLTVSVAVTVWLPSVVSVTPPYIEEIVENSPAAKAGLRPDDLIVYVDGELVQSIKVFRDIMRQYGPKQEIKLEVQRANKLQSVKLIVEDFPKVK